MDSALESRPPTCQYAGIPDLMEKWLDGRYRAIAIGLLNPLVKDLVDPNLLPPLPFRFHANLGIPTVPSRCANPCLKCGSSTSGASGPSTPAPTTTATSEVNPALARPGIEPWSILVLALLEQGINCDIDRFGGAGESAPPPAPDVGPLSATFCGW